MKTSRGCFLAIDKASPTANKSEFKTKSNEIDQELDRLLLISKLK